MVIIDIYQLSFPFPIQCDGQEYKHC